MVIYNEVLNIDIYEDGLKIIKFEEINLGDILFFHRQSKKYNEVTITNKYPGHVGIYIGNKNFIHSTSDFNEEKWIKKI